MSEKVYHYNLRATFDEHNGSRSTQARVIIAPNDSSAKAQYRQELERMGHDGIKIAVTRKR